MCETYNGWTNRETWTLNLWLSNDQGLYEMTHERVDDAMASHIRTSNPDKWTIYLRQRAAGETIKAFVEQLCDPSEELLSPETIIQMLQDIGSLYRVDWDEIGAAWLPEDES